MALPKDVRSSEKIKHYYFRDAQPQLFVGTMSDRYAGWVGQIYSEDKYQDRITTRVKTLKKNRFTERVLPVESVSEYFQHFPVLEIDFTFYRLLLDQNGEPTTNYRVLQRYHHHMGRSDRVFLKVPQAVFARKLRQKNNYVPNEDYLNTELFMRQFYTPSVEMLSDNLHGFIFEQEYQRKESNLTPEGFAVELDDFFSNITPDNRFHVEIRTARLLTEPLFSVLRKHQIGMVLSQWTWLPRLREQRERLGSPLLSGDNSVAVRLVTPQGMTYEQTYAAAFPFDAMVEGMLHESTVEDTVEIIRGVIQRGSQLYLFVNNRAGGNAPMIAARIVNRLADNPA
jgi:uncharacterized protein YecE (DUF72 family)